MITIIVIIITRCYCTVNLCPENKVGSSVQRTFDYELTQRLNYAGEYNITIGRDGSEASIKWGWGL